MKRIILNLSVGIILLIFIQNMFAQDNPLLMRDSSANTTEETKQGNPLMKRDNTADSGNADSQSPLLKRSSDTAPKTNTLWQRFSILMAKMNKELTSRLRGINENFTMASVLFILGFAVLYGFLHAAGPGHGKSLLTAYFIGNKSKNIEGIWASFAIGIMHSLMGLLIAVLFVTIFRMVEGALKLNLRYYFGMISGSLIVVIGLYLFISKFFVKRESEENLTDEQKHDIKKKNLIGVAVAAGVVPCELGMAIAFYTFSLEYYALGITVILGISLGISLFLMVVSLVVINAYNLSIEKLIGGSKMHKTIQNILHFGSALFIVLIGVMFFISNYAILNRI